ncbi:MBOAT family O-acyltransferase [uncultured Clostridium sp.]|uniref:MBOAT family O-acyltransferase n=1 Tax=uncultured Clostridium sp. TaxID=59620 RepID=UPI002610D29F|nr:MBOAT family O-acyltransferase [uncultured Clostridium sp.]
MVFSSIIFLFTFLPITLGLYYISPRKFKNLALLIMSLIFYAWGEPLYIFLMLFTTIFDFFMGKLIARNIIYEKKAMWLLIFTVAVNILILGFFKYYGFLVDNINMLFSLDITKSNLPLPIGISFYTFQTLSYIIDVYLGKVKVQKNIVSFSLYVTMFPQLVAGPIVRYSDVNKQLDDRTESFEMFGEGVERFILGLGKKVLLANNIGFLWTTISAMDISELSVLTAWLGIIAFTFQIYFDFSAYSDMAIGLGKMFGFDFIENFDYPYTSKSITEFWRRWHISLGTWFREYIYIPLGGNRCKLLFQCRNLFIVWLITGLWHGASWNFVVWGLYYGAILLLEKLFLQEYLEKMNPILSRIYTMLLVMVGWVFFGLESLSAGLKYLKTMFLLSGNPLIDNAGVYYLLSYLVIFILLVAFSTPIPFKLFTKIKEKNTLIPTLINAAILFTGIAYLVTETYNPFLYFRF